MGTSHAGYLEKKENHTLANLFMQVSHSVEVIVEVDFLWNRTVDSFEDKLSSTTVDFIRSEG